LAAEIRKILHKYGEKAIVFCNIIAEKGFEGSRGREVQRAEVRRQEDSQTYEHRTLNVQHRMMNVRYMASPTFAKASAFIKITADKTAGRRVMVLVKG